MREQHVINYVETDALVGFTLREWRRSHMVTAKPRRRRLRVPVPRLRPASAF